MSEAATGTRVDLEAMDLIGGESLPIPGDSIVSHDPAHPERTIWSGAGDVAHIDRAVEAARSALPAWSGWGIEKRIEALRSYQALVKERAESIGDVICAETGKARWDALSEAKLLASKVDITLAEGANTGRSRVSGYEVAVAESRRGVCRFRPHGVLCVLGPYNFPAHLPNGHIVPALLTGNTIVFKPSDKTPAVGQLLASLFIEALDRVGAPRGVVNLVQGGVDVASGLVRHPDLDGILFTGSWPVGRKILEANLDRPGRIVALEMGGNNGAIVLEDADLRQAAIECVRAAFVTTGQRCTCTRRLIVHKQVAGALIPLMQKIASNLIIGDPLGIGGGSRNQSVFMGPMIRAEARDAILGAQRGLVSSGGRVLLESVDPGHPSGGHYITPGMVEVERFTLSDDLGDAGCDVEFFGPLLRVATVDSLDEAIEQCNATRYGLASAIFTRDAKSIDRFLDESRAGCVNVNTGTAGASSALPFGGLGLSGNHRPAGAFSLDYTAYPVASLIEEKNEATLMPGMHFEESWLAD